MKGSFSRMVFCFFSLLWAVTMAPQELYGQLARESRLPLEGGGQKCSDECAADFGALFTVAHEPDDFADLNCCEAVRRLPNRFALTRQWSAVHGVEGNGYLFRHYHDGRMIFFIFGGGIKAPMTCVASNSSAFRFNLKKINNASHSILTLEYFSRMMRGKRYLIGIYDKTIECDL